MRKFLLMSIFILLLPPLIVSQEYQFGAGISGGLNVPLVQDDEASGSTFGFRGIIRVLPMVSAEPNLNFSKNGDPKVDEPGITNDLEGSKVTSFGVDAKLGAPLGMMGFRPFATVGLGFYKAKRDQTEIFGNQDTNFGWSFGLGFAIGMSPAIGLDVRSKFNVVPTEGGSADKSVYVVGGVNFFFGEK